MTHPPTPSPTPKRYFGAQGDPTPNLPTPSPTPEPEVIFCDHAPFRAEIERLQDVIARMDREVDEANNWGLRAEAENAKLRAERDAQYERKMEAVRRSNDLRAEIERLRAEQA